MRVRQRDDDRSWMEGAPCRGLTHLFYPSTDAMGRALENEKTTAEARLICDGCHVRETCLEYAIRWREPHGVWGGMTTNQRLGRRRYRRAEW